MWVDVRVLHVACSCQVHASGEEQLIETLQEPYERVPRRLESNHGRPTSGKSTTTHFVQMERNCTKFVVHNSFDFEVRLSESLLACALGGCHPRRRTPGACNLCFAVSRRRRGTTSPPLRRHTCPRRVRRAPVILSVSQVCPARCHECIARRERVVRSLCRKD
jgi:hypothetical protein